jgi:DNA-binding NtrC family response regulator
MNKPTILLVDDEPTLRFAVRDYLEGSGFQVLEAGDLRNARRQVAEGQPDAAVFDYRLPDGVSTDVIPDIKAYDPDLPIVVLTGHGTIDLAVQAIKLGADHFMTKPVELAALKLILDRLVANRRTRKREVARTRRAAPTIEPFAGASQAIGELRDQARRVAATDRPVLIQGETGSGKGVLAKWLHASGPRADEPFVDLNCAGFSRELLESELFGHEKGAFTGAVAAKQGLLEVASGGSVFLDEIGDMDLALQAKLLKVVEDKRFRRVGDVRDRQLDIRLIAATHRDLGMMVREDRFRSDLYFRISTIRLVVPPLRERKEDIPALAETFLRNLAQDLGRPDVRLAQESVRALQRYAWPGNVRELRNVIERALLLTDAVEIAPSHLRFEEGITAPGAAAAETLADVERAHIERILALEGGHVERAATRLGIPRSSLYQRLKKYNGGDEMADA